MNTTAQHIKANGQITNVVITAFAFPRIDVTTVEGESYTIDASNMTIVNGDRCTIIQE